MTAQYFQLSMRTGPNPGEAFPLEQAEVLLGRDLANDVAIGDPEVSRRHARFFMRDDDFFVEDLGSTNGTFLNGERISSPKQLRAGDVITFGENIVMVFEKSSVDPDATIVSDQGPQEYQTPPATPHVVSQQVEEQMYDEGALEPLDVEEPAPVRKAKAKRDGFPTWLIILIIAIVVLACVIAVTLYFMPASWWCAITFDMLEGCPIP
ncbi:MAG: FHA domain-containing protein [Chloroflexota bacterium]|nr:FHA domain-containing protein [Chloroflexota bacterium]